MTIRAFISVEIPEDIKKKVIKIQDNLPVFLGKKTEAENLHLTLKFLGEVSEDKIKQIKNRLGTIKMESFKTEIDGIGFFSESFIRIIWLHLTDCEKLQKKVDDALKGLFLPEKRFMGHLTIARVKNVRNKKNFIKEISLIEVPKTGFIVRRFNLKKSILKPEGPEYEDIEAYNLK